MYVFVCLRATSEAGMIPCRYTIELASCVYALWRVAYGRKEGSVLHKLHGFGQSAAVRVRADACDWQCTKVQRYTNGRTLKVQ